MKQYKVVFFDWGGVIASDPGDEFLGKLLSDVGASEQQVKDIFAGYMKQFMRGQITEAEYWAELKAKYNLAIHDTISEEFTKWKGLVANEEVLALVDRIKAEGIKVAILSNVIEPTYNVLEKAGYYDRFDLIIASCKVGYAKPESEIYTLALERAGVNADESMFIDDKQLCLDPAAKMGVTTILAQSPSQIVHDTARLLDQPV
jgi:epoxide hydrolase-like predicted phosphatase